MSYVNEYAPRGEPLNGGIQRYVRQYKAYNATLGLGIIVDWGGDRLYPTLKRACGHIMLNLMIYPYELWARVVTSLG